MYISEDIKYVGVNDHDIDLFEGQYIVPEGMAYNSYAIIDEKIAITDSVDARFTDEWFANIEAVLNGRTPDYLIIHHMEPDHSANIQNFTRKYPQATLVSNQKAFTFLDQFFTMDPSVKRLVVKNKDTLDLGAHKLTFVFAPMVHWPEVMFSYDSTDKVLFSADAFGKFGANDVEDEWDCEARRYYVGIVGKYGVQVQNVLKAASALDIQTICPLHGPVLSGDLSHYMQQYQTWSSYGIESEGVLIAYTSVYGHTKAAVELLEKKLLEQGCPKVAVTDLARDDMAEAVEDAFRYGKIVLATTTYNADIFPFMREFITHLLERNYQNRKIGFIENGTWAPMAKSVMKEMLEGTKNNTYIPTSLTIRSAMKEDAEGILEQMAKELLADESDEADAPALRQWTCKICGYIYEGEELPDNFTCPLCRRPASFFEEILPDGAVAEAPVEMKKWVCRICGYIYEGEALPADFKCPICKRGTEAFEAE